MSEKVVGLDVSLTTIGWAIIETGGRGPLVDSGYLRLDQQRPDEYDNFDLMGIFIHSLWPTLSEGQWFAVEDMMGYGQASGKLAQRAELVGMIKQHCWWHCGYENVYGFHPSTARKLALGRGTTPHHYDGPKEWVLSEVADRYDITWTKTRYDNIRSQHEDEADAIVVAAALRRQILQGGV